jgi:hypothetical protein
MAKNLFRYIFSFHTKGIIWTHLIYSG